MLCLATGILALFMPVASSAAELLAHDMQESLKERPVMKVVRLLEDTKAQLNSDLEDDKKVHELLYCWCTTNDKEKSAAIEQAQARVTELESFLDEATAKMQEIKTKRDAALDEVDKDWDALKTATELRMKENTEFQKESNELSDTVRAAEQAIVVLSKHHPELAQVRALARHLREVNILSAAKTLTGSRLKILKDFLDAASQAQTVASFLAVPGFQSYAPSSGQVFGILKQMKEDFEKNLSEAEKREKQAVAEFEALKAAKDEEIASGKKLMAQLDMEYAELGEKKAQATKELEDTKTQLGLDGQFLLNLRKKCSESDAEFDARVKSRLEEIEAVEDTIKILNSDEAFDNFDKTSNVAFFQTSSSLADQEQKLRQQRAASLLALAGGRLNSPRLTLLASSLSLDAFTKVKEVIDKMVAELTKQQQDEVAHRDWCKKEKASNELSTAAAYDTKANLEAKMADLKKTLEVLAAEAEATKAEMADMEKEMKSISEIREGENADFQQTVTDQRLTQMILSKALVRMKQVYAFLQHRRAASQEDPQPGAAHTALSGNHTDPGNGPARFTKYEKSAGGSRVVSMLEKVIADSVAAEGSAMKAEEDAQAAYEILMKQSNQMLTAAGKKIVDMTGAEATAKEDLLLTETDLKQTMTELEGLTNMLGDLTKSCKFIVDNFDERQAARTAEIDALHEAKAILSGMN